MSEIILKVNGVEYNLVDDNITSSEYAMGATSAYMAFTGSLPKETIEAQVKQYEKALKQAGKYSKELVDKYADNLGKLVGRNLNIIFTVASGVITGVFDKNMNPDKSLDEILAPIGIDVAVGSVGRAIGMWAGGIIGSAIGPVGTAAGAAIGAALGNAIASGFSSLHSDDFYKTLKTVVVDTYKMVLEYDKDNIRYKFTNDELCLTCPDGSTNPFAFVDNDATIVPKEFHCNRVSYIGKNSLDEFIIDFKTKNIEIKSNNDEALKAGIQKALNQDIVIQTLTLNNQTYNIKNLSNLELRNAIDSIPQVSFLLSHILIKVGEYLDLGEKGIYKVKSGDTLSVIAQKNGMVTKDLVKLNPWLCDEGRIKFNQNKVLIEGDPLNLSNTNHTLYGETNAENLLIDANGGDNIFIGGYKKDIMQSKAKGYDKYFTNANDEITDYDGKGEVWYNSNQLLSATKDNNKNDKYFYDNNGGYYEITSKGLKYTDINGETLIINSPSVKTSSSNSNSNAKLKYETLGIKLYEIDKDDGNGDNQEELKFTTLNIIGDRAIEGNDINFIITLSRALEKDLVLNLTTRDDDALAGKDYEAQSARIVIPAGTTKYTYSIPTIKDGEVESVEHFFLDGKVINLSDFTDENGKVYINENATGMGVIVDKDSINLTISNPSVNEADGKAIFDISLSKPLDEDLDLVVSTHNKTATSPMDFTKNSKNKFANLNLLVA